MDTAAGSRRLDAALVACLTCFALAIHGFHPYAEDGGVYIPGIKRLLMPGLYGAAPAFVLAPTRTSLFAPLVAGLVRLTHVPLAWMLLMLYVVSVALTLTAALDLAKAAGATRAGCAGAATLLACWLTLPVAGTSLMLFDPYVTSRTLSTPLILFAVGAAVRRRWVMTSLLIVAAAPLHPLMTGYGVAMILCLICVSATPDRWRRRAILGLVCCAVGLATTLMWTAPPEQVSYLQVVSTRYYWFLMGWQWYEQVGAIAPLLLLVWLGRGSSQETRRVAGAATLAASIALGVALVFARTGLATHRVAELQPLRMLQMVYLTMIVLLGHRIGERWLGDRILRWAMFLCVCGVPLLVAARLTYAGSAHFETPWGEPKNPWEQAFLWVRGHTLTTAVFALDARYITEGHDEDAQGFRAITERNVLADYSKDGGVASVAADLSEVWLGEVRAQANLNRETDAERLGRLVPRAVTWVVLDTASMTGWECPYTNATVKVCKLPQPD